MLFTQLIIVGLLAGCVYGLVAVGFSLVLGVGKIANFSHGSFVGVGLYLAYVAKQDLGISPYLALIPGVVLFGVVGYLVARLFEWRGSKVGEIGELLVGLALLLLIAGILEVIFTTDPRIVRGVSVGIITVAGLQINGTQIVAAVFALLIAVALYLLIRGSRLGRAMRAVAENAEAAALYGIQVPRTQRLSVILSIVLAGVSGMIISPFTVITPDIGATFLISAFAIVIIGGVGNTLGALVAGIGYGLVTSIASGYLPSYWTTLVPLTIILLFLMFKPEIGAAR